MCEVISFLELLFHMEAEGFHAAGRGIPALIMADGLAGLRLCQTCGVDKDELYPVIRDSYGDLLPRAGIRRRSRTGAACWEMK